MYTIIMNDDKQLIGSKKTTLYQREKLADQIRFLVPQKCGIVDLTECSLVLHYIDQGNVPHDEFLAKDSELYKDRMQFYLPVDSKLNYFAGNISIRLIFMKINKDTGKSENILISSNYIITIEETDVTNSIEAVEMINVLQKQVDELKKNQVDDLKLTDDLLQLTIDDKVIGDGVKIQNSNGNCDCEDGDTVIDIDETKNKPDSDTENQEENNVVEF